jgi:hypothetical protein
MAHGWQRSSLSVATGLRRRCSADCQGPSAKSPRPHEPPRQRAAHRFAQARRGATEGGSDRSPTVECGSGRRWAQTEPWSPNAPQTASESRWRVSARIGPPTSLMSVGRILSRFLGQGGAGEEATSPRAAASTQPSSRHRARFTHSRAPGLAIGHGGAEHPEWASGRSRRPTLVARADKVIE